MTEAQEELADRMMSEDAASLAKDIGELDIMEAFSPKRMCGDEEVWAARWSGH